jgi:CBS domain-containing protein
LNKKCVKYVLIGGTAAILYGSPRVTKDIDILIEPSAENSNNLLKALKEAGFGTANLTSAKKILNNEVTIFKDYTVLDVFTKLKGSDFKTVWQNKRMKRINHESVPVIDLDELIKVKKAAGRDIDLEDVKILRIIKKLQK